MQPTKDTYLTVYPGGVCTRPPSSSINAVAGQIVPNLAVTGVSRKVVDCAGRLGSAAIYNAYGEVDVLVDLFGWFTNATFALDTSYGDRGAAELALTADDDLFDFELAADRSASGQLTGLSRVLDAAE